MSDGFIPAVPAGPTPLNIREGEPRPDVPAAPADILHLTGIAEEIASAFRHMGDVIPALQPLLGAAQRIEARVAALREMWKPPAS